MKNKHKIIAKPGENQIIIEDKKVRSLGQNYMQIKIKNKLNLNIIFILFCIFLIISAVVLLILYLCGI